MTQDQGAADAIADWLESQDGLSDLAAELASKCEMPDWEPEWIFPIIAKHIRAIAPTQGDPDNAR